MKLNLNNYAGKQPLARFGALLLGLILAFTALADNSFSKTMSLAGSELILNGQGERKKAFVTVYDAGLYLVNMSDDAADILASKSPLAIRLVIRSKLASAKRMAKSIREGFEKSMQGDTRALQTEIDAVVNAIKAADVSPGDVFLIAYAGDDAPVEMHKNGGLLIAQQGAAFRRAMLGIWLSENPVQASLKSALLGKP